MSKRITAAKVLWAIFLLCPISFSQEILDEQIADLTKQLAETPGSVELRLQRAALFRAQNKRELEKADLVKVIAANPKLPRPHVSLARLHFEKQGYHDARASLARAFALGHKNPATIRLAALTESELGSPKTAVRFWEKFFAVASNKHITAGNYTDYLESLIAADEFSKAAELRAKATKSFPKNISLLQTSGKLAVAMGDLSVARAYFRALSAENQDLIPVLALQEGEIWHEFGHVTRAKSVWGFALMTLEKDPELKESKSKSALKQKLEALVR